MDKKQDNLNRYQFDIVECSGEDPDHPVHQLQLQSPKSKGWHSARLCSYPQRITIEFKTPFQMKQFQLLSHQNKISTKVQLQVMSQRQGTYKNLGKMTLDSNQNTKFSVRELKSVIVDVPCYKLRMILHKNHVNQFNQYNQIAVIAVSAFGLPIQPSPGMSQKALSMKPVQQVDKGTSQLLKQLNEKKNIAVAEQDYQTANILKLKIAKLKQLTSQLFKLQELKARAVADEDFDAAKEINLKIRQLRESAKQPDKKSEIISRALDPTFGEQLKIRKPASVKLQQQTKYRRQFSQPVQPDYEDDPRAIRPAVQIATEKQTQAQPQKLSKALVSQLQKYFSEIDEQIWEKIYAKQWTFRQEGLNQIMTMIGQRAEPYLHAVKVTISDKVAQVFTASNDLLSLVIQKLKPRSGLIPQKDVQFILNCLLDRLGDNNSKLMQLADKTLRELSQCQLFSVSVISRQIFKTKEKASPKILVGRTQFLKSLVQENLIKQFDKVISFALRVVSSPKDQVRSAAYSLFSALGQQFPSEEILARCSGLRLPVLQQIKQNLKGAQLYQPAKPIQRRQSAAQKREKPAVSTQKQLAKQKQCQFCGIKNPHFQHEDVIDMHLFKQCQMMTLCDQCSQIIPVQSLAAHLMSECKSSSYYKKCSRCKQPIHNRLYKSHTQEKACTPAKPLSTNNRCPLCHDDIQPGKEGWIQHLTKRGCPRGR